MEQEGMSYRITSTTPSASLAMPTTSTTPTGEGRHHAGKEHSPKGQIFSDKIPVSPILAIVHPPIVRANIFGRHATNQPSTLPRGHSSLSLTGSASWLVLSALAAVLQPVPAPICHMPHRLPLLLQLCSWQVWNGTREFEGGAEYEAHFWMRKRCYLHHCTGALGCQGLVLSSFAGTQRGANMFTLFLAEAAAQNGALLHCANTRTQVIQHQIKIALAQWMDSIKSLLREISGRVACRWSD